MASSCLLLLAPSANRVYAGSAAQLGAAELSLTVPGVESVSPVRLAGVDYLGFSLPTSDAAAWRAVAGQSAAFAAFERRGELLAPIELPNVDALDDDLVTIPKYQGKTNEMFTRALLNLTLSQVDSPREQLDVLDPLAGRGTTLFTAWLAGHNAYGVEADAKSFDAMAAYLKTWLRRKRLKHTAEVAPVRREGRSLGRRLDVTVRPSGGRELKLTTFTGPTDASASLFGRKRFDAIVTDAPYGVVHRSKDAGGHAERSPFALLRDAVPVWAGQLRPGGALGISWNTLGLPREKLADLLADAGLRPLDEPLWHGFAHRVDSSINRDLIVATKPTTEQ